ncbi:hypothetical protein LCGC14_1145600, partial [marine sediment metagenome]
MVRYKFTHGQAPVRYLAAEGIVHLFEPHFKGIWGQAHFQMALLAAPPFIGPH